MILYLFAISIAQGQESEPDAADFQTWGESRTLLSGLSDYPVDAEGTTVGQPFSVHQRIRTGAAYTWKQLKFSTEWDVLTGQIAGDTWAIDTTEDERRRDALNALSLQGISPRSASVQGVSPLGQWEAGLVNSQFGMGMVANDGTEDPLFGRADFGDRVIRLRNTTQPFDGDGVLMPVYLTAAVDRVFADDMARMSAGQVAWQGILSAMYAVDEFSTGTYMVYRNQREPVEEGELDRITHATLLDGYVSIPLAIGSEGWRLKLETELAGIVGNTNRATTVTSPDRVRINSGGAAGRLQLEPPGEHTRLHLRGGFASGDADPDDGLSTTFTMDRDFDAGMVLFKEVLGSVDAATHALLSDPDHSGSPPDGVDTLLGEGAIRSALYAQPAIEFEPLKMVELRAGAVLAWSTSPVRQAFYSHRAGGVPYNHHNQPAGGYELGKELNWAVLIKAPSLTVLGEELVLDARFQGGHAFLAQDLAGQRVDTVHLVTSTIRARW
ncbi:MAG: hypothetical protein VX519_02725 [Myxococcota bacterium]|nr:hypothetical protein [Myxococcota bacterium]